MVRVTGVSSTRVTKMCYNIYFTGYPKMNKHIFNTAKSLDDYQTGQPLFFGVEPGLFDSIHKPYPRVWELYKIMQSLTWDANEFDYTVCNTEFKTCSKPVADIMIRTLMWQWEADSVASRAVITTLAPFVTDTSLWAALSSINTSEQIHAETYSEIVRMSFDDPTVVLKDVLSVKETIARMDTVNQVFANLRLASIQYSQGLVSADDVYDDVLLAIVALYLLERLQFMASFSITFTICASNLFQPIGKAVQKIAQDELEVHAELDKEVIRIERSTKRGADAYTRILPKINALCDEVVNAELVWTDYLFSEGRELVGTNSNTVKQFVLYNAKDVYKTLGVASDLKFPAKNPMPHIDDWIDISKTQAAPQEQDNNQYKVNSIVRDDTNVEFDVDF
jgi:ribonucleoside-diphosphate reductase beta chain